MQLIAAVQHGYPVPSIREYLPHAPPPLGRPIKVVSVVLCAVRWVGAPVSHTSCGTDQWSSSIISRIEGAPAAIGVVAARRAVHLRWTPMLSAACDRTSGVACAPSRSPSRSLSSGSNGVRASTTTSVRQRYHRCSRWPVLATSYFSHERLCPGTSLGCCRTQNTPGVARAHSTSKVAACIRDSGPPSSLLRTR